MKYLQPESFQTLREGINELRAAESQDTDAAEIFAAELKDDIDSHDAIHVLFACPTTLEGEIAAHVWTAFGTTAKLADMHRVNAHNDHRTVLRQIGHRRLLWTWLKILPRILVTICNAQRMKRRWPVEETLSFLDRHLCDIRKDSGIRLPAASALETRRPGGAALRNIRRNLAGRSETFPKTRTAS